jgi:hypothetical protein
MKAMVACVQEKINANSEELNFVDFLGKGEYLKVFIPIHLLFSRYDALEFSSL